jgi:hypothetical protein
VKNFGKNYQTISGSKASFFPPTHCRASGWNPKSASAPHSILRHPRDWRSDRLDHRQFLVESFFGFCLQKQSFRQSAPKNKSLLPSDVYYPLLQSQNQSAIFRSVSCELSMRTCPTTVMLLSAKSVMITACCADRNRSAIRDIYYL